MFSCSFPMNIAKFLRTPILRNICKRLLLMVALINPWLYKPVAPTNLGTWSSFVFLTIWSLLFEHSSNFNVHCVKSVQIRSFFWSLFSCIRTEYGELLVNLRIESEYKKMRTRNNSAFGHFSRSGYVKYDLFINFFGNYGSLIIKRK